MSFENGDTGCGESIEIPNTYIDMFPKEQIDVTGEGMLLGPAVMNWFRDKSLKPLQEQVKIMGRIYNFDNKEDIIDLAGFFAELYKQDQESGRVIPPYVKGSAMYLLIFKITNMAVRKQVFKLMSEIVDKDDKRSLGNSPYGMI